MCYSPSFLYNYLITYQNCPYYYLAGYPPKSRDTEYPVRHGDALLLKWIVLAKPVNSRKMLKLLKIKNLIPFSGPCNSAQISHGNSCAHKSSNSQILSVSLTNTKYNGGPHFWNNVIRHLLRQFRPKAGKESKNHSKAVIIRKVTNYIKISNEKNYKPLKISCSREFENVKLIIIPSHADTDSELRAKKSLKLSLVKNNHRCRNILRKDIPSGRLRFMELVMGCRRPIICASLSSWQRLWR